jgi:hypothetical protein
MSSSAWIDQQRPQVLRIDWKDGLYMVYSETTALRPGDPPLLRDNLGGLWGRELLLQGNSLSGQTTQWQPHSDCPAQPHAGRSGALPLLSANS